ncbi:MAG: flagellar export chaperone FliS [Clostridiales bacterium]|nr:flagellar export chaperone FliS [Clostridiales bacterium]
MVQSGETGAAYAPLQARGLPAGQKNPQEAYRRQKVLTASPMELILMLYDECRKRLLLGQRAMARGEVEAAHNNLARAQDILNELINCLDLTLSIGKELLDLYWFLWQEIGRADHEKSEKRVEDVLELIGQMRETWQQVCETQRGSVALED